MSEADVISIAQQALAVSLKLSGPILVVSLVVGLAVSLVQAVTSVQEASLAFVPKLAAVAVVMVVAGGWMLDQLGSYTRELFESIPRLVAGG